MIQPRQIATCLAAFTLGCAATLLGCGGNDRDRDATPSQAHAPRYEQPPASGPDMRLQVELTNLQTQFARIEQSLVQLQVEYNERMNELVRQSQQLSRQIVELKERQTTLGAPSVGMDIVSRPMDEIDPVQPYVATGAATAPVHPTREDSFGQRLLKLIVWVIVIVAVIILIRFFVGRKDEEFDDFELDEDELPDEERQTDLGAVSVSPNARRDMQDAGEWRDSEGAGNSDQPRRGDDNEDEIK